MEQPFKHLMVCMDLTEMDNLLIRYAGYLYREIEGIEKITFAHNILFDYPEEAEEIMSELDKPLKEIVEESIEEQVEHHLLSVNPRLPYEVVVREEDSTPLALAKIAKRHKVSLTIVGKKVSYSGTGMVASKMLRLGDLTSHMLMVPETAHQRIENILVPVDFSRFSKHAIRLSRFLQQRTGAQLTAQHVMNVPSHYFPYIPVEDVNESMKRDAERSFRRFIKSFKDKEVENIPRVMDFSKQKSISERIYEYAFSEGIDLIVVGTRGRGGVTAFLLGSVAMRLIEQDMHIPLLIVRTSNGER